MVEVKNDAYVLVPREPTDAMLQAGFHAVMEYADSRGRTRTAMETFRAMIDAALAEASPNLPSASQEGGE